MPEKRCQCPYPPQLASITRTIVFHSLNIYTGDIILEASGGAQFSGGSCAGAKRYYGSTRNIVMPTSGNSVEIWAGIVAI